MRRHFTAYASDVINRLRGVTAPIIFEIGYNNGILLEPFAAAGVRHLGIDPAGNVLADAVRKGVSVQQGFFNERTAADIAAVHGHADAIVAANVICHIADIHSVFAGVRRLLAPSGLFVFEDPYVGSILDGTAIDQIYDEHVFYFSATAVSRIAAAHDLEIVDIAFQTVHGGELRYCLAGRGVHPPREAVAEWIGREQETGVTAAGAYRQFAARAAAIRDDLRATIGGLRSSGRRIAGYGATAKSSTIINYCGLGPGEIEFIADVTPTKQGTLTPGAHIPVRPPEFFRAHYPDYAVLFAWNHAREIREKEAAFEARGGRWITYVPAVTVGLPACSASHA
jgi:methylation protein EvaC